MKEKKEQHHEVELDQPPDLFEDLSRRIKTFSSKMDLVLFAQPMKAAERESLKEDLITLNCFFLAAFRQPSPFLDRCIHDIGDPKRKPKDRKHGSWFTPPWIAEWIVKQTLGPLIQKIRRDRKVKDKIGEVLEKRVCDPCVGGGIFLVCAHDYLMNEILLIDPKADLGHLSGEVASRCLYGVDINPEAVEGCRLALQLNIAKWALKPKIEEFARTATPSSSSPNASCGKSGRRRSARGTAHGSTSTRSTMPKSAKRNPAGRAGRASGSQTGTALGASAPASVRTKAASGSRRVTPRTRESGS